MVDVQQYFSSIFKGQNVVPVAKSPAAAPVTGCLEPLNLGTSHLNPVLLKGAVPRTVNIHSCGGKKLSLPLGPSTTVEELKSELQRQTGYTAKNIDLVSGSQTLDNGFDLGRLHANANLVLVHKVYGG